jgi:aspartyl/glutamyl-tRNA(Asn/Gln) amidotransferase C subunit
MPRLPRAGIPFRLRTYKSGPKTSFEREDTLRQVKKIDICPEIESLLKTPTWSVSSLLPHKTPQPNEHDGSAYLSWQSSPQPFEAECEEEITREKLHHLLKLSALPPPQSETEENQMLRDLKDQVHFVKQIQKVDTTGVQPLVAIRDETAEYRDEHLFTRASLAEYIALEEKQGKNGTIRRKQDTYQTMTFTQDSRPWKPDPLIWSKVEDPWNLGEGSKTRKMGQFFFVKRKQAAPAGKQEGKKIEQVTGD